MSLTTEQLAAQLAVLKTNLVNLKNSIVAAFQKADFAVDTLHRNANTEWPSFLLTITHAAVQGWQQQVILELTSGRRFGRHPEVIRVEYKVKEWGRGRYRRYTSLSGIEQKLVVLASEAFALAKTSAAARAASKVNKEHWAAVRAEQLNGLVLPNGTSVNIIEGNGPEAGKYRISFDRHNGSIEDTNLSADQVRRLVALLNEIQGTANLFYIRAESTNLEGRPVLRVWKHNDWYVYMRQTGAAAITREQAEALLPAAKAKAGAGWSEPSIAPLSELTAIGGVMDKLALEAK